MAMHKIIISDKDTPNLLIEKFQHILNDKTIKEIEISGNLSIEVIQKVINANIQNPSIKTVTFSFVNLCLINSNIQYLLDNSNIKKLSFFGCYTNDNSKSLVLNFDKSSVQNLIFTNCKFNTNDLDNIIQNLKTNKKVKGLFFNYCSFIGNCQEQQNVLPFYLAGIISELLESNFYLEKLSLIKQEICDDGIEIIFNALSKNNILHCLALTENKITDEGMKFIANKLQETGLKQLSLSGSEASVNGITFIQKSFSENKNLLARFFNLEIREFNNQIKYLKEIIKNKIQKIITLIGIVQKYEYNSIPSKHEKLAVLIHQHFESEYEHINTPAKLQNFIKTKINRHLSNIIYYTKNFGGIDDKVAFEKNIITYRGSENLKSNYKKDFKPSSPCI